MTQAEFLGILRRRLAGLPPSEIDEMIADCAAHFADGMAMGRSESDIAAALGDPIRLARELRAEAGFRRWEGARTPANFAAVVLGLLALMTVDFVFVAPLLVGLALFTLITGIVVLAFCLAGLVDVLHLFHWHHAVLALHPLSRTLRGIGLLGFGIGGGALLLLLLDFIVRALGRVARMHYTLLNRVGPIAEH
jgi:uncharacterized membrane protein